MAGLGGSGLQLVQVDLPITISNGGTGQTAFTDGQILIGQTSSGSSIDYSDNQYGICGFSIVL